VLETIVVPRREQQKLLKIKRNSGDLADARARGLGSTLIRYTKKYAWFLVCSSDVFYVAIVLSWSNLFTGGIHKTEIRKAERIFGTSLWNELHQDAQN
jgi:hypothetical protein